MAPDFIDNFPFEALRRCLARFYAFERYFFIMSLEEKLDVTLIITSIVPLPWKCKYNVASADVTSLTVLESLRGKISPPSSQYEVYPF